MIVLSVCFCVCCAETPLPWISTTKHYKFILHGNTRIREHAVSLVNVAGIHTKTATVVDTIEVKQMKPPFMFVLY